jgi:hypothetical protein
MIEYVMTTHMDSLGLSPWALGMGRPFLERGGWVYTQKELHGKDIERVWRQTETELSSLSLPPLLSLSRCF